MGAKQSSDKERGKEDEDSSGRGIRRRGRRRSKGGSDGDVPAGTVSASQQARANARALSASNSRANSVGNDQDLSASGRFLNFGNRHTGNTPPGQVLETIPSLPPHTSLTSAGPSGVHLGSPPAVSGTTGSSADPSRRNSIGDDVSSGISDGRSQSQRHALGPKIGGAESPGRRGTSQRRDPGVGSPDISYYGQPPPAGYGFPGRRSVDSSQPYAEPGQQLAGGSAGVSAGTPGGLLVPGAYSDSGGGYYDSLGPHRDRISEDSERSGQSPTSPGDSKKRTPTKPKAPPEKVVSALFCFSSGGQCSLLPPIWWSMRSSVSHLVLSALVNPQSGCHGQCLGSSLS